MGFIPVADTVEAELRFTLFGQKVENTLYFKFGAAPTPTDFANLGAYLRTWWNSYPKPLVSYQLVLNEVYMTDLSTATSPTFSYSAGLPIAGSGPGQPHPNNVAFCLSFKTAGRGRSSRGRNYISGIEATNISSNQIDPTLAGEWITAYINLRDGVSDATGSDWVVVSRYLDKAPRAAGVAQPVINVTYADLYVDSQRRRLPGRGQ